MLKRKFVVPEFKAKDTLRAPKGDDTGCELDSPFGV